STSLQLSLFFFSSRRRHTRFSRDWSSDVCSSDLAVEDIAAAEARPRAWVQDLQRRTVRTLRELLADELPAGQSADTAAASARPEIGRASCRERVWIAVGAVAVTQTETERCEMRRR